MLPPQPLVTALEEFDRGLRCRWSSAVGRFCIERRHGYAGTGTDEVLATLHDKWQRLEKDSHDPLNLDNAEMANDTRAAFDEYESRKQGYQPIFYVHQSEIDRTDAILLILLGMDIRRAGGPDGWVEKHKDAQEQAKKVLKAQRKERLREIAERAYDHVACKKDFHAQGSDAFFYPVDRK